jgi:mitochondrial fission protein ELM1
MNRCVSTETDFAANAADPTPRVWLVSGYRAGERSQILALAEALGWPFEFKELSYRKGDFRSSLLRGSDLREIQLNDPGIFAPPWPDLVISAGMRNEPVCRWIRNQSGGKTRIVHIGRPWARFEQFDLVITTPQYRLPERDNVLHNTLTLHRITSSRLDQEGSKWKARFAHLPPPYLGVILGGNSGPYTLGPRTAASIAARVNRMAGQNGASLLISTSARTADKAIEAFQGQLSVPHYLYRWRDNDQGNPYFGILALSDELVVTADSISMLSEACATGKPVYMAELGGCGFPMRPDTAVPTDFRFSAWTYSWMMRIGPQRLSRDIRLVHRKLLSQGRVAWLGQVFTPGTLSRSSDLDRALSRVRALMGL